VSITLPDPDAPICTSGKRPHRTEELARKAMTGARISRGRQHNGSMPGDVEEAVRECKACGWWHVTSSSRPRRRGEIVARGRRQPKRR
jgi:hypothetical protein